MKSLLIKARHGIPLGPTDIELFLLLFADDLTLLASTVIGLQNQLNVLSVAAERLCLTVNLDKSKVIVFRKGGFLAAKEKWFLGGAVLEVVNKYKYLGLTFSTGHSFAAMEDTSIRAKKSTLEVLRALKKIFLSSLMHRLYPHCCMLQKSGATETMNKLNVCTFLLVRNFCMCVIRLQMMLFTEN